MMLVPAARPSRGSSREVPISESCTFCQPWMASITDVFTERRPNRSSSTLARMVNAFTPHEPGETTSCRTGS